MTTIAYRDGVIAADTLVTSNGVRVGRACKIARHGQCFAGASGDLASAQKLLGWFAGGREAETPAIDSDDVELIVIEADGVITTYAKGGIDRITAPFYAIGSGRHLALGAMSAGASAKAAVEAAASLDVYTGGDIEVLAA